jgi:hypothetical protein
MSQEHSKNPDLGPAFVGLIGGAAFIGVILYAIVLWTNSHFAAEKEAHKAGAMLTPAAAAYVTVA